MAKNIMLEYDRLGEEAFYEATRNVRPTKPSHLRDASRSVEATERTINLKGARLDKAHKNSLTCALERE
jgi:hypothetical protein